MTRRLRVAHVIVQPVLAWDDGENLAPGPSVQPQTVPLAEMQSFLAAIPAELERLALEADQAICTCGRSPLDNMPLIDAQCPVHGANAN